MKIEDVKIKLSIRSILLFEELSGKSFGELGQEDYLMLLYSIVAVDNPEQRLTFEAFLDILQNKKIARDMYLTLEEELKYVEAMTPKRTDQSGEGSVDDAGKEPQRLGDIALGLVFNYGLDLEYVMDKMSIWELVPLARMAEEKTKIDMSDKRFWTYMTILPHIDGKKAGGPEKLLPFPWEKKNGHKPDDTRKFMEENSGNIMNLFKNNKDKGNDDEIRNEDIPRQVGLHQDNDEAGQAGKG